MTLPSSAVPVPFSDLIASIHDFLASDLETVTQLLGTMANTESSTIREVALYSCLSTGKKLRPMITLLAARAFTPMTITFVKVAAAMEALHVATLLHDDVIDRADIRRGRPSVNAKWGDDVAILVADYLFAATFNLTVEQFDTKALLMICDVAKSMSEGEMLQIERRGQSLSLDDYMRIIACKTGRLFSVCSAIPGVLANLSSDAVMYLSSFGLNFGFAFQMTDDTLDYMATDQKWGKSPGQDFINQKQTLPLIMARSTVEEPMLDNINRALQAAALDEVKELLSQCGAIDASLKLAGLYAQKAQESLRSLTIFDQTAFDYLVSLPQYVIQRDF